MTRPTALLPKSGGIARDETQADFVLDDGGIVVHVHTFGRPRGHFSQ
jgi:hypothetical protein